MPRLTRTQRGNDSIHEDSSAKDSFDVSVFDAPTISTIDERRPLGEVDNTTVADIKEAVMAVEAKTKKGSVRAKGRAAKKTAKEMADDNVVPEVEIEVPLERGIETVDGTNVVPESIEAFKPTRSTRGRKAKNTIEPAAPITQDAEANVPVATLEVVEQDIESTIEEVKPEKKTRGRGKKAKAVIEEAVPVTGAVDAGKISSEITSGHEVVKDANDEEEKILKKSTRSTRTRKGKKAIEETVVPDVDVANTSDASEEAADMLVRDENKG
jgi:hypothetical protein